MTDNFSQAIQDIQRGKPIIIVDDPDRENEGDIVIAVDRATRENLLFAMNHAKGLMCIASDGAILDRLEIGPMVSTSTCKLGTPFTVSIDASSGITTGMSVEDRLQTLSLFCSNQSVPADFARPGHLFPLRANANLLNGRRGHTEASVAIMKLAKVFPAAVIVEIMNERGQMVRGAEMTEYLKKYNLTCVSVDDIAKEYSRVYGT